MPPEAEGPVARLEKARRDLKMAELAVASQKLVAAAQPSGISKIVDVDVDVDVDVIDGMECPGSRPLPRPRGTIATTS